MKKIILFLLILIPALSFAQINFVVKGKVNHIDYPSKIFIFYRDGSKNKTDSVIVKNHYFEFKGTIADTSIANIIVDYKGIGLDDIWKKNGLDAKQIYLVNSTTTITGSDSLYKSVLSGNNLNDEYYSYSLFMQSVMNKWAHAKTGDDYDKVEKEKKALNTEFLNNNPNSYVSLDQALPNIARGYVDADTVEPIFLKLSKEVRSTRAGVAYQTFINNLKNISVRGIAPEFDEPDAAGKMLSLSSLKGKYVLIDFWASWCVPCRDENPNVVKIFNKYKTKNFTVLGVSLDKDKAAWLIAIKSDGLTWNHVADLKGWNNSAALLYGIKAIPQNFLIDPSGKIIGKNLFGDDLDKKLAEVLTVK